MDLNIDMSLLVGLIVGVLGIVTFVIGRGKVHERLGRDAGALATTLASYQTELDNVKKKVTLLEDKIQKGEIVNATIATDLKHISEIVERMEAKLDTHLSEQHE